MTFINIPVEWFSIGFDWTWMLLFGDIRQGIFYAMLLSFWIIFCGEHMMVGVTERQVVAVPPAPCSNAWQLPFSHWLGFGSGLGFGVSFLVRGLLANLLFLISPPPAHLLTLRLGPERAEPPLGVLEAGWTHSCRLLLPLHLRHVREVGSALPWGWRAGRGRRPPLSTGLEVPWGTRASILGAGFPAS